MPDYPIVAEPCWEVRISSQYVNLKTIYPYQGIDEVMEDALLLAQEEDAYAYIEREVPGSTKEAIEEAVNMVRFLTFDNKEDIDARQADDNSFFSIRINKHFYSIVVVGFLYEH